MMLHKRQKKDTMHFVSPWHCKKRGQLILAGLLAIFGCGANEPAPIHVVGAMKNVMLKGELFGTIALDTIAEREHLYGLGPLENLVGEILIADGVSYVASVEVDSSMRVERRFDVRAPFLVYGKVARWEKQELPENVHTLRELETFLDRRTQTRKRPFAFRLTGLVKAATIHVVNLPPGSQIHSPEDAHQGQRNFSFKNKQVQIIGFFSTSHQGIFTHHDSFIHAHLLTDDKSAMGHLDEVEFAEGQMELYLPAS